MGPFAIYARRLHVLIVLEFLLFSLDPKFNRNLTAILRPFFAA